jgi:mRNA interferase MazF
VTDSTEPRRGEIWLTSFGAGRPGEPGKNRPAIVISDEGLLTGEEHELIVVVPLSSSLPPSALRPRLAPQTGIDSDSAAIPRAISGVARRRLVRRLGTVQPATMGGLERALRVILDLGIST